MANQWLIQQAPNASKDSSGWGYDLGDSWGWCPPHPKNARAALLKALIAPVRDGAHQSACAAGCRGNLQRCFAFIRQSGHSQSPQAPRAWPDPPQGVTVAGCALSFSRSRTKTADGGEFPTSPPSVQAA